MFDTIKKLITDQFNNGEHQNTFDYNHELNHEFPPSEWKERDINKWLKRIISDRRNSNNVLAITRHIALEIEEDNIVNIIVLSKYYFQVRIEAELIDMWHDHRTSSVAFKVRQVTVSQVPLLPRFFSDKLSNILLGIFGIIFSPLWLKEKSQVRLSGDTVYIDMHDYLVNYDDPIITKYIRDDQGQLRYSYFIIGLETSRGIIRPIIHQLSAHGKERSSRALATACEQIKPKIFNNAAIWQLSIVAMVVSFCVVLLYPFLSAGLDDFSLTPSFFSSLILLIISLLIINIAREVFNVWMRFRSSYRRVEFAAEDNNYKLERLTREIELEMDKLKDPDNLDFEKTLFRSSRYRGRAREINRELEIANLERKIKYATAYIVTIISELAAYNLLPAVRNLFK